MKTSFCQPRCQRIFCREIFFQNYFGDHDVLWGKYLLSKYIFKTVGSNHQSVQSVLENFTNFRGKKSVLEALFNKS